MKNLHKIGPAFTDAELATIWVAVNQFHAKIIARHPTGRFIMFWYENNNVWDHWGGYPNLHMKAWSDAGKPIPTGYTFDKYLSGRIA